MFRFIDFMYTILFNEISNLLHEPKIDAVSIWISIWSMLIIIHLKCDLLLQTYINNYLKWREFLRQYLDSVERYRLPFPIQTRHTVSRQNMAHRIPAGGCACRPRNLDRTRSTCPMVSRRRQLKRTSTFFS